MNKVARGINPALEVLSLEGILLKEVQVMIESMETGSPSIMGFRLSGKLNDEDQKSVVPAVEKAIAAEGKVRLIAAFCDFHGWDIHAAWDDLKFGLSHYSDFERIAMVGDRRWESWLAVLCRPFTKASVKYFNTSDAGLAWAWVREGTQPSASV